MKTDLIRLNKEILHERLSIWYVWDDVEYRVLIKAPGTSIKALSKGCKLEFTFGRDAFTVPCIMHIGYRIYDPPVNYLSMTGPQRFYEEHFGLAGVMQQESVLIQFHDELCVCTATARLHITEPDRQRVLNFVGNAATLFSGEFNRRVKKSLDAFDFSLGQRPAGNGVYTIDTLVIEGTLSEWVSSENTFVLGNEVNTLKIDDPNQGAMLEKQVVTALDNLFGKQLYHSPHIAHKNGKTRELIDIFGISDYGIFLIETKALNVLTRDDDTTIGRKVAGVKKQVNKAIDQLVGAARKIAEYVPVFDKNGTEIVFDRKLFPHCIVVVSELFPIGEWQEVVIKTFQATLDQPMYLNVMDLNELMHFIGSAQGKRDMLDYFLMQRRDNLMKHLAIHAKAVFVRQEKPEGA